MLAVLRPVSCAASVTVEEIGQLGEFASLRSEWNRLLTAGRSDCFFLTWEWMHTWWCCLGSGRLSLLAVRAGSELVAIAPFFLGPRFRFGYPLETLQFLGSGFAGSDYLDVIVKAGWEDIALRAMARHLARQSYAIRWTNVGGGALAMRLAAFLSQEKWSLSTSHINVCPYIPLAGMSWDSYLGTLGSEHRYNFRRKWRLLNRGFSVDWETAHSLPQCRDAIEIAFDLHRRRWSGRGTSDAFHTPELMAFHREIVGLALERGWLRLHTLRLNRRPVASLYGFLYREKFYFYQSGFDPAFSSNSVGLVSMGLAIQDALAANAGEFDLLHGDEVYKLHWANVYRSLFRLELFPSNALSCVSKIVLATERRARRLVRRALGACQ